MKEIWKKYKEMILYIFFGAATTAVNFAAFVVFDAVLGTDMYLVSNIIAWAIAVAFAYVTNKLFVFESKSWKREVVLKECTAFIGARVFSLVVEELGFILLLDICGWDELSRTLLGITVTGAQISKLILAVVVIVLNYVFSKLLIFKKK